MASNAYESILASTKEYAVETDNTRLLLAVIEPTKVWDYLEYFVEYAEKGEDGKPVHPFYGYFKTWGKTKPKKGEEPKIKVNRSYVSNVKSAIKRYDLLVKVLTKEDTDDYKKYHAAELQALNAYAFQVLLDIVKSEPKALDNIEKRIKEWQDAVEAEKAAKAAEKAAEK